MRFPLLTLGALALTASVTPALAQDEAAPPPAFKVTGGATLISEYRFRGLTQTNEDPAVQGTININSRAGFYVGTWASTIDGGRDGSTPLLTGYGSAEVDLYGGFTKTLPNGLGVDAGLLYYYYADGVKGLNTDFFEPYASLSYTIGPVAAKVGAAYAWGGQKGLDFTGGHDDNIYGYAEGSVGIPTTPVSLKGHVGYTNGSLGLVNPDAADHYLDWSLTAEAVGGPLKVGVTYVDTNVTHGTRAGIGNFDEHYGRGSKVLGYVGVAF